MPSPAMSDEQLAKKYGRRTPDEYPLFEPYHWGYRCPRKHKGESIAWSSFNDHIWCQKCKFDYPSADCPMQRPSWMDHDEFGAYIARLPYRPKILPGVDRSIEPLDKAKGEG